MNSRVGLWVWVWLFWSGVLMVVVIGFTGGFN
jgi:hypothetical protein